MSDLGEKTCPICAEEMDVTDLLLKPCKCGYDICIWCWHQIMDRAEKDEVVGRCPACRIPYNKEKIVGTAANCERLVAERNMEKKMKPQKAKPKTSDGRKQLSTARVIQRNLAYIVGIPLSLVDEDLLQRREYFGQYGKVLKVSISRTAAGSIQHFPNNTCSVYITYSKEEEAVRCIQSVHGFLLDGRSLRACFGTTKYCHAWLRNVPCSNPDCLYLHEFGSHEDSFTKDEIISAYTRNRVQQVAGATSIMQRRSGNVLPPPADDYYINSSASSGKPIIKSASSNPATSVSSSPPNGSSSQSVVLPAAAFWGTRASSSQPPSGSLVHPNVPRKLKPETCSGSLALSTAVAGKTQVRLVHIDSGKKLIPNGEARAFLGKDKKEPLEPGREDVVDPDNQTTSSEAPVTPELPATSTVIDLKTPPSLSDKDSCIRIPPNITNSFDLSGRSSGPRPDKDPVFSANESIPYLCSDMESININRPLWGGHSGDTKPNGSLSDNNLVNSPQKQGLQQCYAEYFREPSTSTALEKAVATTNDIFVTKEQSDLNSDHHTREQSDWRSDSRTQLCKTDSHVAVPEVEEDLQNFKDQRHKDPEVGTRPNYFANPSNSIHLSCPPLQNETYGSTSFNLDPQVVDDNVDKYLVLRSPVVPKIPNGHSEDIINRYVHPHRTVEHSYLLSSDVKKHVEGIETEATNANQNVATGLRESSIISNILSMDFDAWDESSTSPPNLAKLLGETDKRDGSLKLSSSWKVQNSSQSRFSFARQEESTNQVSYIEPSLSNSGQVLKDRPLGLEFGESRDFNFDKLGNCNGFSTFNMEESDNLTGSNSYLSSNKLPASRSEVSTPPGFSLLSRAPPPGFASHERPEPTFGAMSWNSLNSSSLVRNPYQALPTRNLSGAGDIEFMDPAILAVGKGRFPGGLNNAASLDMRSNFSAQFAYENEARLQSLMQRSVPPLHNQRFSDLGDGIAPFSDAYRSPSRNMEQTLLASNLSPLQQSGAAVMSNSQWDGWDEIRSRNDIGMLELLRTERLGFNKLYNGYEDSMFRLPSSGDLYNRTYGI